MPQPALEYTPGLFPEGDADRYMSELREQTDWEQHQIRIAGRSVACPRLSAWEGDPGVRYRYSGLTLEARGWQPRVREIREVVERATGVPYNSVLLQLYRDGSDGMGWHADDEAELGPEPPIASVSFGAPRRFVLRHKRDARLPRTEIVLEPGSLLFMYGHTQRDWKHALPKTRRPVGPRINLTFRRVR
jgi:alkylated DNA repair dioxygenase AlkB